ncbi:tripartite tricarboxylate transporter permease [Treponema sp. OMZ 840]|uniref:tripartite tricarboxylate transporter permease n=1 Tax=Treponema sp. OMZ 840 TaxID=244313 RepID=UPI003D8B156A
MDTLIQGLLQVTNLSTMLWMAFGSILGIILGALPGLTATMGIALIMPISFHLPNTTGIGLLLAVYCGAVSGASIPAILLGIPGNPNAIATVEDGILMTKKGKADQALGGAVVASFIGGMGSLLCLVLFAPIIAKLTLAFGPAEKTTLALVGLVIIASVSANNVVKGLLMGAFGMTLAFLGTDPFSGHLRIPFSTHLATTPLAKGLDLTSTLIGLYGISQVFFEMHKLNQTKTRVQKVSIKNVFPPLKKLAQMWKIILSSTGIGTIVGAIPGTGASVAVFLARNTAKDICDASKGKLEPLGTGSLEGVFAPEVANNAVTGGALIPALALGIPGDAATAVLIGALMIKGITPGFQLFQQNMTLVYAIFATLFISNIFMAAFQLIGIRLYPKVLGVPSQLLLPLVLVLSFIGAYAIAGQATAAGIYNMGIALVMGLIGYVLKRNDFPIAPIVLGLILGSMFEENFRRAVKLAGGNYFTFFTKPICLLFIGIAVFSVVFPIIIRKRKSEI